MKRSGLSGKSTGGVAGFTLVELMTVMLLIAIMVGMAVPVYLDSTHLAEENTCKYNQRVMESAIMQWGVNHTNERFITENCLPGDGEAYLDLKGNVPGEPERSLAPLMKRGFDCPSNGQGVGQIGNCDYITDGYAVACLTDNQIDIKLDGTPFKHDRPVDVEWSHFRGTAGAEDNVFRPEFVEGEPCGWDETRGDTWAVLDGIYRFGDGGRIGEHRSFWGNEDWKDYVVSLSATLEQGSGFGVYFRATGGEKVTGYCFQYDPGYGRGEFIVRPVVNGREQGPIARYKPPADYDWYNTNRDIVITSSGNNHSITVDGKEVLSFTDDRFPNGRIGLRGWHNSEAEFSDIEVRTN